MSDALEKVVQEATSKPFRHKFREMSAIRLALKEVAQAVARRDAEIAETMFSGDGPNFGRANPGFIAQAIREEWGLTEKEEQR